MFSARKFIRNVRHIYIPTSTDWFCEQVTGQCRLVKDLYSAHRFCDRKTATHIWKRRKLTSGNSTRDLHALVTPTLLPYNATYDRTYSFLSTLMKHKRWFHVSTSTWETNGIFAAKSKDARTIPVTVLTKQIFHSKCNWISYSLSVIDGNKIDRGSMKRWRVRSIFIFNI